MYLSHYRLKENPFQISTNPAYLWLGEKHREALATLRYGIEDNKGFLLLTGDVGTGKTTLINSLIGALDENVVAATVPDPGLDQLDFFHFIAGAFGIAGTFTSKGQFLVLFRKFLLDAHAAGKKVLLIIDEAQRLTAALLEEIRLLSNIELPDRKLINIFFVGQNEFNTLLLQVENRAIRQRITVSYDIRPLSARETWEYLRHRLRVAGADREIFTAAAVQQVHSYSRGYPRLINVIADRALLTGFVEEVQEIGSKIVLECAAELRIPAPTLQERRYVEESRWRLRQTLEPVENAEPVEAAAPPGGIATAGAPRGQGTAQQTSSPEKAPAPESPALAAEAGERVAGPGERRLSVGRGLALVALLLLLLGGAAAYLYPRQAEMFSRRLETAVAPILEQFLPIGQTEEPPPPPAPTTLPVPAAAPEKVPPPISLPQADEPMVSPPAKDVPPVPDGEAPAGGGEAPPNASVAAGPTPPPPEAEPEPEKEASPPAPPQLDPASLDQRRTIRFAYDDNGLSDEAMRILDELTDLLRIFPYEKVSVNGYSDALGIESYNRKLSQFRADLVRGYLLGRGVPAERIVAVGRGSADPVAGNDTMAGRQQNRRVEIDVLRR